MIHFIVGDVAEAKQISAWSQKIRASSDIDIEGPYLL